MAQLSIAILTLNEEANLPACLASCQWCDDVVVFDSYSSDNTVEIARQHGARVVQRRFDNYAAQRNSALHDVPYRHQWVFMLDADERIPQELAQQLQNIANTASDEITLVRMRRKDFFFNRWLKRSSGYPTWFGRMMRPDRVTIEREINEEFVTDGQVQHVDAHLHHYPFNKGITWWYERHNRYSSMEAQATLVERSERISWRDLLSVDPSLRRRNLKRLAYRLPMRPLVVFVYLYLVRLGFMDGMPGLYFSAMRASYELMIDIKVRELRFQRVAMPPSMRV